MNPAPPVITVLGPAVAYITTGGFVVELVFAVPGLGRYFIQAVQQLDYTVIMGTTVFYGAFLVVMVTAALVCDDGGQCRERGVLQPPFLVLEERDQQIDVRRHPVSRGAADQVKGRVLYPPRLFLVGQHLDQQVEFTALERARLSVVIAIGVIERRVSHLFRGFVIAEQDLEDVGA